MKNEKGSSAAVAGIVIVAIIVLALVVPWTLSLVDTTRTTTTNGMTPSGSGGLSTGSYGTIGMRFELTELVGVNQTRSGMWIWLNDDTLNRVWTVEGRITADVPEVHAIGIIGFESKTFSWTTGSGAKFFEYVADADAESAMLAAGWYKYVLEFTVDTPGLLNKIAWNFGIDDRSEAGYVPEDCFRDDNRNGLWEAFPIGGTHPYLSLVLEGDVIGGEPPAEDEEEEEPLITTTPPKTGMLYEDYDWIMYAILGGVIVIVLVAVVIMVRL